MKIRFSTALLILTALLFVCLCQTYLSEKLIPDIGHVLAAPIVLPDYDIFHNESDYDSGWTSINQDEEKTFIHNLGGDPDTYFIDLQFKDTDGAVGVNQEDFGGEEYINFTPTVDPWIKKGAYWFGLTNNEIEVKRLVDDKSADQVRVRIWIAPVPSFKGDWIIARKGLFTFIDHNVGGDTDNYIVDLQFKDTSILGSSFGVNQYGYGIIFSYIDPSSLNGRGANWGKLTETSIVIQRGDNDEAADNVRVRIWENPNPDYDSGWFELDTLKRKILSHNLGGNSDDYVVDFQFKNGASWGINQRSYGSNFYNSPPSGKSDNKRGALWSNLNPTQIAIRRERDDTSAPEARVRIWVTRHYDNHIYLTVVMR